MRKQNLKNHSQIVWSYYLYTGVPILILVVLSIIYFINEGFSFHYPSIMFLLTGWIFLTMLFRARGFALKAQDRAIRAEEGLRYFILTGKRLNPSLSIKQIVALRFAGDEELPALVQKTIDENLGNRAIKHLIRNWRADEYRV
jgi:hypothetical protein